MKSFIIFSLYKLEILVILIIWKNSSIYYPQLCSGILIYNKSDSEEAKSISS
jgi:hypothetical protein